MEDGVVDAAERSELASQAEAMSLSADDVDDILGEDAGKLHARAAVCPHCGLPLGSPTRGETPPR